MNRLEERVADQLVALFNDELNDPEHGYNHQLESKLRALPAALESQGLKIVPVEPTEAMLYEADERMRKWVSLDLASGPDISHAPEADGAVMTMQHGGRNFGKTWERFKQAIEAGLVPRPTPESLLSDFQKYRLSPTKEPTQ